MKRYKVLLSLFCVVVFVFLAVGSTGNDEEPAAEPDEVEEEVEPEEKPDELSFGEIAALTGELTKAEYELWLPHHMWLVGDLFLDIGYFMEGDIPDLREEDRYEIIIDYCRNAQEIMARAWNVEPPAEYEDLHQKVLAGFTLFDESMDAIIEGIEEMDESKIVMADDKMEEGFSNYIEPIMETIDDWEYWDM